MLPIRLRRVFPVKNISNVYCRAKLLNLLAVTIPTLTSQTLNLSQNLWLRRFAMSESKYPHNKLLQKLDSQI